MSIVEVEIGSCFCIMVVNTSEFLYRDTLRCYRILENVRFTHFKYNYGVVSEHIL